MLRLAKSSAKEPGAKIWESLRRGRAWGGSGKVWGRIGGGILGNFWGDGRQISLGAGLPKAYPLNPLNKPLSVFNQP